jgi:hypothetical protein
MLDIAHVIYWVIALASLVAWARFATFMCADVSRHLVDQPELPWKLGSAGIFLVMLVVYLIMPFWVALPTNFVIAAGVIGAFWYIRVKTMGPSGHLFRKAIQAADDVSRGIQERKNARQVQLTYLRHDNTPMMLPGPQDPLAVGLGTADAIVIQALMRRAEIVDLAPAQNAYSLVMFTDGVGTMQDPVDRGSAEASIQAFNVLAGL